MKQLTQIPQLLNAAYGLIDVTVKMQDPNNLIVDIPCTRWNNERHQEYFITPNKIGDLIKDKLNLDLTIIMIM